MNREQQEQWMETNIQMLIQRAAQMDINAYIVYAYLNGAAQGIGANLSQTERNMIDKELDKEFEDILD